MKHREYIDDKCEVICEENGKKIVAEILEFQKQKSLTVSLDRSVKLNLRWNGKIYEGSMGRLSFVSNGPDLTVVKVRR